MIFNRDILEHNDYIELESCRYDLLTLAKEVGSPISSRRRSASIIDVLKPTESKYSHEHSLSQKFGVMQFPYHTDGAYLPIPPKYLLFKCSSESNVSTPTILLPFLTQLQSRDRAILNSEIWAVKGRTFNFYTPILQKAPDDRSMLRFDPICMTLVSKETNLTQILESVLQKENSVRINWTPGKVLILNNWRMLHMRPDVDQVDLQNRVLERILINE